MAVLGWCLCLGLVQVKGSYGPGDLNKTIQNLLDHYVSTGLGPAAAFVAQFDRTPASESGRRLWCWTFWGAVKATLVT